MHGTHSGAWDWRGGRAARAAYRSGSAGEPDHELGGINPDKPGTTFATLLDKTVREQGEGILDCQEDVRLVPASIQLSGYESALPNEFGRESMLRQVLEGGKGQFDHVIIDCQPPLNILTVNALDVADSVLIPTQPQYFLYGGIVNAVPDHL